MQPDERSPRPVNLRDCRACPPGQRPNIKIMAPDIPYPCVCESNAQEQNRQGDGKI